MNPKRIKFLKEKYEKENKGLRFQEEFIVLPGLKPISGKFYTKHDALFPDDAPVEFFNLVKRCASSTPEDNFKFPPPCTSMGYGWFAKPLIPRSLDSRLTFSLKQCNYVKTEIYIRSMEQKIPQEKFSGIPFRF